ncbi:MAG TPA: intradiol ring-cleavage dioxygenase [Bryobacteraceae bacterium]|nr:intradiol ring-cleavage dioxygenase [Bryobacteraceae bacterium]
MKLTRRGLITGGAAVLACSRAMPSTPACTLAAEQESGPYYLRYENLRSDITEGRPGVPLKLRIALVDARRCAPLPNAALDIWHCDAMGVYSGFTANNPDGRPGGRGPRGRGPAGLGFGPPGGPPPARRTDETRFLRGVQMTGQDGIAEFATICPGWYVGRTIHIHLKVHLGGHVSHTGQVFLPEEFTEQVAKIEPYAKRLNVHRTLQREDGIFNGQHGADSLVDLHRLGGTNSDGFLATVMLAVDPEATPPPAGHGRE